MAAAPTSTGDGGAGDGKSAGACDYLYTLNGKPLDSGVLCAAEAREAREESRRAARRLAAGALGGGSACGGGHDENTTAPDNDAETTELGGRATRTVDECVAADLLAHCEAVEASECVWSEEVAACGAGAGATGRLVEHRVHEQVWRERHTRAPYAHQVCGAVRSEHGWLVQDVDVPIDCAAHARWYDGGDDAATGIEICLWRGAGEKRRALFRCFLPADFASFLCEQGDAPFFGFAAPPQPPQPSAGRRRRYYTYHMDDPLVLHFSSDYGGAAHDNCDDVAPAGGVRNYEATKRATEKLSQRISLVRISFPDPQRLGEARTHAHAMPRQHIGHAEAAEAAAVAQRRASDRVVRWRTADDTTRRRQQCAASRRRRRARPPHEARSAAPRAPSPSAPTALLRTKMLECLPPLPVWQQEELVDFLAAATASPKSNAGAVDGDVLDYLQNYDGLETAVRRGKDTAAAPPPKSPEGICEPFSRLSLADGVQGSRAMAHACV